MIEPRPTLAQYQREAQAAQGISWTCPRCGCKDWRVYDTRQTHDGGPRRLRCCRHCKTPMPNPTQELQVPSGHRVLIVPEDVEPE